MTDNSSIATIRDVYDLVDRTRQETTGQITSLAQKFDAFAQSNEHRLTIVETHQAAQAQQLTEVASRLDDHGRAIGALKDQQAIDEAAEKNRSSTWTKRTSLIAVIASAVMAIVGVISALHL